jgi:hypothetical protein
MDGLHKRPLASIGDYAGRGVSDSAGVFGAAGFRDWSAFTARAPAATNALDHQGRYRQGAGPVTPGRVKAVLLLEQLTYS